MPAITIDEAARELEVSPTTIRRWIARGAPVARQGRRGRGQCTLVDPIVVAAWTQDCEAEAALVALAGRIPELLAEAALESFRNAPDKRGCAWALAFNWQLAASKILDALRKDAPAVPDLETVPAQVEALRKLATK